MPQLNKGGKFIFGFSVIQPDLSVKFPPQTLLEYDITKDGKVIIFTGSKVTGGFCATNYSLLSNSKLGHILKDCTALGDCSLPEGEFIQYKGRSYTWLHIDDSGLVKLTPKIMDKLQLHSGAELLSIRSSNIAFTMGAKGPLFERAYSFNGEIERY